MSLLNNDRGALHIGLFFVLVGLIFALLFLRKSDSSFQFPTFDGLKLNLPAAEKKQNVNGRGALYTVEPDDSAQRKYYKDYRRHDK